MPTHKPVVFKRSLLAVAIVSLSACSTAPRIDDYDLSRIGDGIMKAGRVTADTSERVWDRTTYLLGFSDGDTLSDDTLLKDEVDIAMAEEDALMPLNLELTPVTIPQAVATTETEQPEMLDDTVVALDESAATLADAALIDTTSSVVAVEDLVHEVASAETLWDISKKTTGDANNWHILADVNNLSPTASVYPGQQLIIPSDMVKPGYLDAPEMSVEQAEAGLQSELAMGDEQLALADAPESTELLEPVMASADAAAPAERLVIPELDASELEAPEVALDDTPIKLAPGETLWDFSKRTTGDATNWQAIAAHNSFTEKQAVLVRPGQSINVPDALLKPDLDLAASDELLETPQVASAEPVMAETGTTIVAAAGSTMSAVDETAVEASSELLAQASTLDETQLSGSEAAPMTIVEATYKTDPSLVPRTIEKTFNESGNLTLQEVAHGEIMVSGTYYPKAIYNDADFSSSLLMRVSPGTTLQVSKAMGNWFEVETDKGVGYVHQRDIK